MDRQMRVIFRGVVVTLPFLLTIYLIVWLFETLEDLLSGFLRIFISEEAYIPGLGLVIGLICIYLVGLSTRSFLARRFGLALETSLDKVPLIRTIYSSLRDLFSLFGDGNPELQRAGLLDLGNGLGNILGFITQSNHDALPPGSVEEGEEMVAFYIPMSYQVGGFTVIVPRSKIKDTEMSIEECLKFCLTAGVRKADPDVIEQLEAKIEEQPQ